MSVTIFWIALALVVYTYALYPLLVMALANRFGDSPAGAPFTPPLTVIIAACNEESRIANRVRDVLAQDYPADSLRVIVVDDGSSDDTARAAAIGDARVEVIRLALNRGKAVALNAALQKCATEFVAFTDARQQFAQHALRRLLEPFADANVGAVSGALHLIDNGSYTPRPADIGLYWRMERALREWEARLGWLHGVSGAIHAMRCELAKPLPAGTILDDMYLPLNVLFAGRRVWLAQEAIAIDHGSAEEAEEFRRKLRTLAGNWQLIARLPRLLNPLTNPVFFAWFSHKFLRLIVPWALLAALLASAFASGAIFYRAALIAQLGAYVGAAAAIAKPRLCIRVPLLRAAGTFVLLNVAALLALPACVALDPRGLWKKH